MVSYVEETRASGVIVKTSNRTVMYPEIIDLSQSEPEEVKFVQIIPNQSLTSVKLEENFAKTQNRVLLARRIIDEIDLRELDSDTTLNSSPRNRVFHNINCTSLEQRSREFCNSQYLNSKEFHQQTKDLVNMKKKRILSRLAENNKTTDCNINTSFLNCLNVSKNHEENQNTSSGQSTSSEILEISDDSNSNSSFNLRVMPNDIITPSLEMSTIVVPERTLDYGSEIAERLPENTVDNVVINLEQELPTFVQLERNSDVEMEISESGLDFRDNQQHNQRVKHIYVRPDLFENLITSFNNSEGTTSPIEIIDISVQPNTAPINDVSRNSSQRKIRFSDKIETSDANENVTSNLEIGKTNIVTPPGNTPKIRGILKRTCSTGSQESLESTPDTINTNNVALQPRALYFTEFNSQRSNNRINLTRDTSSNTSQEPNGNGMQVLDCESAKKVCDSFFNAAKRRKN